MEIYEKPFRILSSDVDMARRLRISRLFTMIQEASIAHTEALGAGRTRTLDRGYLWVVVLQYAEVNRLPVYDEDVVIRSWPGNVMHAFFPRFYEFAAKDGEVLIKASALWALMDAETRKMVNPKDACVTVPGIVTGTECRLPRPPKTPADPCETISYTVPYSFGDINGHMNNTRYFDLAEDLMPHGFRNRQIRVIASEYGGEVRTDEVLTLTASSTDNEFLLAGSTDKRLFKIGLTYDGTEGS